MRNQSSLNIAFQHDPGTTQPSIIRPLFFNPSVPPLAHHLRTASTSSAALLDQPSPSSLLNQPSPSSQAAAKLKVSEVPYPFTSIEQYERSLAVPAGKEWNAISAARGFARPEILTRAGQVIAPIKQSEASKTKAKTGGGKRREQ